MEQWILVIGKETPYVSIPIGKDVRRGCPRHHLSCSLRNPPASVTAAGSFGIIIAIDCSAPGKIHANQAADVAAAPCYRSSGIAVQGFAVEKAYKAAAAGAIRG